MTGVPDQAILREVEDQMQCHAQFDHAQVAGEMGGAIFADVAQSLANLAGNLLQLRGIERPQFFW